MANTITKKVREKRANREKAVALAACQPVVLTDADRTGGPAASGTLTSHIPSKMPNLAGGRLIEVSGSSIVLGLVGTDYQLHLQTQGPIGLGVGELVRGVIRARARRVDVVGKGGRFIEPVYGRPRRLQGAVVESESPGNLLTVDCGCRFVCKLGMGQSASRFEAGTLVAFDVESGASFEPVSAEGM